MIFFPLDEQFCQHREHRRCACSHSPNLDVEASKHKFSLRYVFGLLSGIVFLERSARPKGMLSFTQQAHRVTRFAFVIASAHSV